MISYWQDKLKKVLKNKELSLQELTEKLNEPYTRVTYWVRTLTLMGFLQERWDGRKKFLRVGKNE